MQKAGLYKKMRENAVVPILLSGIVITLCSYFRFSNAMYNEGKNSMRIIAKSVELAYEDTYPGNYALLQNKDLSYDLFKGEEKITNDYSIVDEFSDISDTDISLLFMDMRVHTTFANDNGARISGIFTNAETATRVLINNEEVFYKNIKIINDKYLVLYEPLYNSTGETIGMIEVARNMKDLKVNVWKSIWPILVIAVMASGFAIFYSYKNTKEIIRVLSKLQAFLNKVAGGNLQAELDSSLTKRTDELGDISKSSVKMQKSIRAFIETDPLTGLNNRRFIMGAIQKVIDKQRNSNKPFCLAICDIDFFKKVNDTYGHNAGDIVLKSVAEVLKDGVKSKGYPSRWGGEEFLLLLDNCTIEEGTIILNNILNRIREMTVEADGYKINITMTFGIVEGYDTRIEELVSIADEKLYYGKTHGRNQVVYEVTKD